jgi:hypothetical protein
MGAHRCCDCDFTPASDCAELVAGDPPDPCEWWPEAYEVSVALSGVSYVRRFNDSAIGSFFIDCDTLQQMPDGVAYCRTINWSWSLSTTIYRVRATTGVFGTFTVRCPDVAQPDDGFNVEDVGDDCNNNGVPDGNTDCGPTPYPSGSVPFYSSPCCCDSAATLSGVADRTFFSAGKQGVVTQFGQLFCLLEGGTTEDSIGFSRKCRVVGFCTPGQVRKDPDGPSVQTVQDGTVRFQIIVSPGVGGPDSLCENDGATAWWGSVSSLILNGTGIAGSICSSASRCDEFNLYGGTPCSVPGSGASLRASSDPLIIEQPGEVGSMGVGDAFGMPLVYEHECGPEGGCSAATIETPYLEMCSPAGVAGYACTQLTVTVTPVQGSA